MTTTRYDESDLCDNCGTPIGSHGDVCDPTDLASLDAEEAGERAREAAKDAAYDYDHEAGSW